MELRTDVGLSRWLVAGRGVAGSPYDLELGTDMGRQMTSKSLLATTWARQMASWSLAPAWDRAWHVDGFDSAIYSTVKLDIYHHSWSIKSLTRLNFVRGFVFLQDMVALCS